MNARAHALLSRPLLVGALAVVGSVVVGGGCFGQGGRPPPTDRAVFPTGLALSPDGTRLAVVSSNFDFTFEHGAVLLADVPSLTTRLVGPAAVIAEPFVGSAFVPTFGDRPVFSADGAHLLLTTRDTNLLHELVVDGTTIGCDVAEADLCDQAPHALGLAQNDPFDVTIVEEGADSIRAFVTHQSGREASFFTVTPSVTGSDRIRLESGAVVFGTSAVGDTTFGVRAVAHRPAVDGRPARLYATVERRANGAASGIDLVGFDVPRPGRAADVVPVGIDLEIAVGSRSARDLVVVTDAAGGDALIVALRFPDAVARFSVDDRSGLPTLTAVNDTCLTPVSLAVARVPVGDGIVERVLVTCQDSNSVIALDPTTLAATDTVRFYGRSPYDVVVDAVGNRAFVSFFLDNSVGVFSLTDGTSVRLAPIGRLGTPLPAPEDGRE